MATLPGDCLTGLLVKSSATRAEDPRFKFRLARIFPGWIHTSNLIISTPLATLPGAWRYRVSAGTGCLMSVYCDWVRWKVWSVASISVWHHIKLSEQICPWDTLACCWDVKQQTTTTLPGAWYFRIVIIIAFQGAIQDFLQSPHNAANCLQHVRSSGPGAIVCKSCATHRALITCKCHVTCHLVRRDSSAIKFDRVEIAFIWASFFIGWTINPMKEGRKLEYPEKTPGDELQKMPHTCSVVSSVR